MMSVTKSDIECTPSAIIAPERPTMPAIIFATDSTTFTQNPTHVTFLARAARAMASVWFIICFFDIYLNRKFTAFPLMAVYFSKKKPHTRHRVCGPNVFYEKIQTVMPFYYSAVG